MLICLILAILIILFIFVIPYLCYRRTFCVPKSDNRDPHILLEGEQYKEQSDKILPLVEEALSIPHTDVYITSFDGFRLHAAYYEKDPDAPVEIMVHGYKSIALRDFSGAIQLALECGHNILLIDMRAHGESGGRCLSFGILERRDCLSWIDYIIKRNGENTEIILLGVSMGAATVLMATGLKLPKNVSCVIADSSFTSPESIIKKVIRDMHLPAFIIYPFIKLGARLYGGFDLEECSAVQSVKISEKPIYFIHGEADLFVPCYMSREMYDECNSEKTLLTVEGAGHGLSFLIDNPAYMKAKSEFLSKVYCKAKN